MKNIKISTKLIVSFGSIVGMIIILSIISLVSLGSMKRIVVAYDEETLPSANNIWDIRYKMVNIELYLAEAISSDSDEEIKELLQKSLDARHELQKSIDVFKEESQINSSYLTDYENKLATAAGYRQNIMDILSKPHTDENSQAARIVFQTKYVPAYADANDSLISLASEVQSRSEQQKFEADNTNYVARSIVFFFAVLTILFAVGMGVLIRRSIVKPVKELELAALDMSRGKLNSEITYQSKDELGALADSFRSSTKTIRSYIQDIDRAMYEMSQGNFDLAPSQPFVGDFKQIDDSITQMLVNMSQKLRQVDFASSQVLSGADQISAGAQSLAQGTTEQASAVVDLLSSVNGISENIKFNAQQTKEASLLAAEATSSIESSNEHMQHLMVAINDVSSISRDISKITKVIEDIAFQTNILSLNAAVEAARAGAAGKGFSIVASEVRNLAIKSAEAAKTTSELIAKSVDVIGNGVLQTESTAKLLEGAVSAVKDTRQIITEISSATSEQANVIKLINTGLDQISSVVHKNSASSEESAASSEELAGQATVLKDITSSFKLKIAGEPESKPMAQASVRQQDSAKVTPYLETQNVKY